MTKLRISKLKMVGTIILVPNDKLYILNKYLYKRLNKFAVECTLFTDMGQTQVATTRSENYV